MKTVSVALVGLFALALFAGCTQNVFKSPPLPEGYAKMGYQGKDLSGTDANQWPSLKGVELTVMDHGAFFGFSEAKTAFEALTGAKVSEITQDDTGTMLSTLLGEKGQPTADVVYGLDNAVYAKAVQNGLLTPYKPKLEHRIQRDLIFFGANATWYATPVDHAYVGVNVDTHAPSLANTTVTKLTDLTAHAGQFVTQNPKTSSPGWGFLISTVQTFGEDPNGYNWKKYWNDLFHDHVIGNCAASCAHTGTALVTKSWGDAYTQHFTAGYESPVRGGHGQGDRAIVTSYTNSPAYEYNTVADVDKVAQNVLADRATWHQVQTMGILNGTKHLAAAQAWIEFTLTDAFQKTRAPSDAVYPVVASIDVSGTYHDVDPAPGSFVAANPDYQYLGRNLDRWLREWTQLCESSGTQTNC